MTNTISVTNRSKIIWAVDPFAEESRLLRSSAWAIRDLSEGMTSDVEPVFLYSGYLIDVPLESSKEFLEELRISGQKALDLALTGLKLAGLQPLNVLSQPYLPLKGEVNELIAYARKTEAKLIVVATHARKGLNRWMMGSFAESLSLYSDIPLFVVNPSWKRTPHFKHILFPTDFSDESKQAFHEVLNLAQPLGNKITLFHKVKQGLTPRMQRKLKALPVEPNALRKQLDIRHREADVWAAEARSQNVQIYIAIDYKSRDSVADAILSRANKRPGLIAMAAVSSPLRAALLGSVTRKVVRASPFPVWILRAKKTDLFSISESEVMEDLLEHGETKLSA